MGDKPIALLSGWERLPQARASPADFDLTGAEARERIAHQD